MASIHSIQMQLDGAIAPANAASAEKWWTASRSRAHNIAYVFVTFTFASVLLVAATLSARSILTREVIGAGFGWRRAGTFLSAVIEWFLAAWLLSAVARVWARRIAIGVLGVFVLVAAYRWMRGDGDCECFEGFHIHPRWTTLLDLSMLAAFAWFGRGGGSERATGGLPTTTHRLPCIAFAAALSLSISGSTLFSLSHTATAANSPRTVYLDMDSQIGKHFPLFDYIDEAAAAELAAGGHTIVLMDRHCHKCQEYLARMARPVDGNAIRVVDVSTVGNGTDLNLDHRFQQLKLRRDVRYSTDVPVEIALRDGIVIGIRRK
jgi:hypothetical protein